MKPGHINEQKPYTYQPYPKSVAGVIVHSAEEEAALKATSSKEEQLPKDVPVVKPIATPKVADAKEPEAKPEAKPAAKPAEKK